MPAYGLRQQEMQKLPLVTRGWTTDVKYREGRDGGRERYGVAQYCFLRQNQGPVFTRANLGSTAKLRNDQTYLAMYQGCLVRY